MSEEKRPFDEDNDDLDSQEFAEFFGEDAEVDFSNLADDGEADIDAFQGFEAPSSDADATAFEVDPELPQEDQRVFDGGETEPAFELPEEEQPTIVEPLAETQAIRMDNDGEDAIEESSIVIDEQMDSVIIEDSSSNLMVDESPIEDAGDEIPMEVPVSDAEMPVAEEAMFESPEFETPEGIAEESEVDLELPATVDEEFGGVDEFEQEEVASPAAMGAAVDDEFLEETVAMNQDDMVSQAEEPLEDQEDFEDWDSEPVGSDGGGGTLKLLVVSILALLIGAAGGAAGVYFPLNQKINQANTDKDDAIKEKDGAIVEKNKAIDDRDAALNDARIAQDAKNQAEADRAAAETARQDAEQLRNEAELARTQAETDRDMAIMERNTANLNAMQAQTAAEDAQGTAAQATKERDAAQLAATQAMTRQQQAETAKALAEANTAEAEKGKNEALEAKALAEQEAAQAMAAKLMADTAKAEADAAKALADRQRNEALKAKADAELAQKRAEQEADQLASLLAKSGGVVGGSKEAAISKLKSDRDRADGLAKAKKNLDLARILRTEALQKKGFGGDETDAQRLLVDSVTSAQFAVEFARKADDESLLLDSLYSLGRTLEVQKQFSASVKAYEEGAAAASEPKEKSRFNSAIIRVRIASLQQSTSSIDSWDDTLRIISRFDLRRPRNLGEVAAANSIIAISLLNQVEDPKLKQLKELAQLAETAVEQSERKSPDAFLSLARVRNQMAQIYANANEPMEALKQYDFAIAALKEGIRAFKTADPTELSDLEGTLIITMFEEFGKATSGRAQISEPDQIRKYREGEIRFRDAEQQFAKSLQNVAKSLQNVAKSLQVEKELPNEQDARWATEEQKQQSKNWANNVVSTAGALAQQHVAVTTERDFLKSERDKYLEAEKVWAEAGQKIADAVDYQIELPEEAKRWSDNKEKSTEWITDLKNNVAVVRSQRDLYLKQRNDQMVSNEELQEARNALRVERDRLDAAEERWADFAKRIASSIRYNSPLPTDEKRWIDNADETKVWMDGLAINTEGVAGPPPEPCSIESARRAIENYSDGLGFLYGGKYELAIDRFGKAIELCPDDARYHYFRGVSRYYAHEAGLVDDLNDAILDMHRGTVLEKQDSPNPTIISRSLERIQFKARDWIESYRVNAK